MGRTKFVLCALGMAALVVGLGTGSASGTSTTAPGSEAAPAPLLCPSGSVHEADLSPVPNAGAILRRICAPGHLSGFVPQGLTFYNGAPFSSTRIIISGYYPANH